MKRKRVKRNKAFIGALIGAGASILGGIMSGISSNNQVKAQQRQQNRNDTYSMAQNLSAGYANQEYVDEFNKRVTFKNGGKMKKRKCCAGTKVSFAKRFACGGRKKAEDGTEVKTNNGDDILSAGISAAGNLIGSAASSSIGGTGVTKSMEMFEAKPKGHLQQPDYVTNPNNVVNPYGNLLRAGGKRKKTNKAIRRA